MLVIDAMTALAMLMRMMGMVLLIVMWVMILCIFVHLHPEPLVSSAPVHHDIVALVTTLSVHGKVTVCG